MHPFASYRTGRVASVTLGARDRCRDVMTKTPLLCGAQTAIMWARTSHLPYPHRSEWMRDKDDKDAIVHGLPFGASVRTTRLADIRPQTAR